MTRDGEVLKIPLQAPDCAMKNRAGGSFSGREAQKFLSNVLSRLVYTQSRSLFNLYRDKAVLLA
jgi:hypothetical protein